LPIRGFERAWGADRSGRNRATHWSPTAPSPAAKADGLAGRGSGGQIPPSAPGNTRAGGFRPSGPFSLPAPDVTVLWHAGSDLPPGFKPTGRGDSPRKPTGLRTPRRQRHLEGMAGKPVGYKSPGRP